jgi:hypothetical protein
MKKLTKQQQKRERALSINQNEESNGQVIGSPSFAMSVVSAAMETNMYYGQDN